MAGARCANRWAARTANIADDGGVIKPLDNDRRECRNKQPGSAQTPRAMEQANHQ